MSNLTRIRQGLLRGLRLSPLCASTVYAAALYGVSLQASIYDIRSPLWILTVGAMLLLSPLYHGMIIGWLARDGAGGGGRPGPASSALAAFPRLFGGQLLVNALVLAGAFLLLLPGIYVGLRLAFYKQGIVIDGLRVGDALRSSMQRTAAPAALGVVAIALAVFYGAAFGLDAVVFRLGAGPWGHVATIVVTGILLSGLNGVLTEMYQVDRVVRQGGGNPDGAP